VNGNNEPLFHANPSTPSVNGLYAGLLTDNPNLVNSFRIPRSNASTCDNDHLYTRDQEAYNGGLMDKLLRLTWSAKGAIPR
jgi:phospholipase C